MKYLYALIPISVAVFLPLALSCTIKSARGNEKAMKTDNFQIRASKKFAVALTVFAIFWAVAIAAYGIFVPVDKLYIFILSMIVLSAVELLIIFGCIQAFRQCISVYCDTIRYTPIIGKTKTYSVKDIDKVTVNHDGNTTKYLFFIKEKKIFSVSNTVPGCELLLKKIKRNGKVGKID